MAIGVGAGTSTLRPTLTVEVAFATDPNSPGAASPTWTSLDARVLTVDCARSGRTDELSLYQSGTATLAVHNPDGMFNPVNATGPYFGQLIPYRPVRILANYAAVSYPLWQGYVERWPQTWVDPVLGISNIECVDALTLLNNIGLDSAYAAEVLSAAPTVYYPLSESSGATTAGNQSANPFPPAQIVHTKSVNATSPGTYAFGGTLDVAGAAAQTGLQFTGTNNNLGVGVEDGFVLTLPRVSIPWTGWTVELWCQIPKTPSQWSAIFRAVDAVHFTPLNGPLLADPPGMISLYHNGPANLSFLRLVDPASDNYLDCDFAFDLADGALHHVAVTYQTVGATGTATIYVDGTLTRTVAMGAASSFAVSSYVQVGGVAINAQTLPNSPLADGRPLIGTVGHVAIYPTVLPIATIGGHYQAGLGFPGEVSGDRADRILAYGAWQSALQQLQQGRSTMGPASDLSGTSLLAALQAVSDAELGTLTVTADGLVDFRSRDDRMLKTVPTLIFGTNVTAAEIPYNLNLIFDYDPMLLFNDIQVSRTSGPTAESFDATSIRRFFPSTKPLTMNVDTDDQTQQAADWVLGREKDPHLRTEVLTVNAATINGNVLTYVWPGLLNLDLHDRVGIRHRPLNAPEIDMDGFVEQLSHHIDATPDSFAWDVSVQVSPVLGNYGIWDSTGSLWDSAVWAF